MDTRQMFDRISLQKNTDFRRQFHIRLGIFKRKDFWFNPNDQDNDMFSTVIPSTTSDRSGDKDHRMNTLLKIDFRYDSLAKNADR